MLPQHYLLQVDSKKDIGYDVLESLLGRRFFDEKINFLFV
ncbi:hypothetical protein BV455_00445 [Parageobacillus caldoxylosilyticus]|nr:hypothetical protein BV455_00445 [Parageobacillus caldoxylosilyticus]